MGFGAGFTFLGLCAFSGVFVLGFGGDWRLGSALGFFSAFEERSILTDCDGKWFDAEGDVDKTASGMALSEAITIASSISAVGLNSVGAALLSGTLEVRASTAALSRSEEVLTSGGKTPPATPLVCFKPGKKRSRELSGTDRGLGFSERMLDG